MAKLLVVGAINTDLIAFVDRAPRAGETVAGGTFEMHGGGKGANQAVSAARSGAEVSLLGAVGDDDFGKARLEALSDDGIDVSAISVFPKVASGVAIIIVEESGENRISDLPGARDEVTTVLCIGAYEAVQPTAILSANELEVEAQSELFQRANEDGIPVWFNIAPYSDNARSLLELVDTLILNQGEAEDILDVRDQGHTVQQLAEGLRKLGVNRVVMTLGSEGVVGFEADQEIVIKSEPVNAVDTTGAGDTFCGAWAAELLNGATFEDALKYANKAAAISVTRRGAQSSIPRRDEVLGK